MFSKITLKIQIASYTTTFKDFSLPTKKVKNQRKIESGCFAQLKNKNNIAEKIREFSSQDKQVHFKNTELIFLTILNDPKEPNFDPLKSKIQPREHFTGHSTNYCPEILKRDRFSKMTDTCKNLCC